MEHDTYLREHEVEALVGLKRTAIWRSEKRGVFPRRFRVPGSSRVLWSKNEIMNWLGDAAAARKEVRP